MAVFAAVISYILQMTSFVVLRRKLPNIERPYRSRWGVPGAVIAGGLAAISLVAIFLNSAYRPGRVRRGRLLRPRASCTSRSPGGTGWCSRPRKSSPSPWANKACPGRRGTRPRRRSRSRSWRVVPERPRNRRHHPGPLPRARGVVRLNAEGGGRNAHRPPATTGGRNTMSAQGMLDVKQLEELSDSGEIDTVLCMFTDLQGRFQGKRVLPHFFLEEVLGEEGLHACLYLLAIDMEMEPLPGYEYASWETGYGDFKMMPDLTTLRLMPVAREDRHGHLRHQRRGHERAGRGRTPADPEAADPACRGRRLRGQDGIGARVLPVQGLVPGGRGAEVSGPAAELHLHHGLPHAPDDQGRMDHPSDPQRDDRRGYPGGVLERRIRQGAARDQHHVQRRADQRGQPRALQTRRQGDLRAERRRRDVHGEVDHG